MATNDYNQKSAKDLKKSAERKAYARALRERQNYAIQSGAYRRDAEALKGKGGLGAELYRLPADEKRKSRDYFFVMRKFVCFLMFLFLLVVIAYFVLGYVKIEAIPAQYTALFVEQEAAAAEEGEEDDEEADNAAVAVMYGADEAAEEDEEEEEEEESAGSSFNGTAYGVLDPIFGALKYWGGKLNVEIKLGDSPMYDSLIAKYEVGMSDSLAGYIILAFPIAMIIYVITALIMLIKAFIGMCGRRIVKMFGLGSAIMLVCAALTAFGGLAFVTEASESMDFAAIVNVLIGSFNGAGGFTGGYGLLLLLGVPVLILILSIFARKKVPYSIFDTFGE